MAIFRRGLITEDCARRIVLLKLTDRHEASRGLSATAGLLVYSLQDSWRHYCLKAGALRDGDVLLSVCSFVRSFVVCETREVIRYWQHLAASGGLPCRLRYTCCFRRRLQIVLLSYFLCHLIGDYYFHIASCGHPPIYYGSFLSEHYMVILTFDIGLQIWTASCT